MSNPLPPPTTTGDEAHFGKYTQAPVCEDCGHARKMPMHYGIAPPAPYTTEGVCPECGGGLEWVTGRWRITTRAEIIGWFYQKEVRKEVSRHFVPGRENEKHS